MNGDNQFVPVCKDEELKDGGMAGVEIGEDRAVVARIGGALHAIGAICTHRQCNLDEGELVDDIVICPCHGSNFNMKTGAVVEPPATEPEPVYDVKVEDGRVWVSAQPRQTS